MPRLQIELTSARPDGTWTWRAAGARQPKGVVDGELLPAGAKVGDVLRVEADVELDGTTVRSVLADTPRRREREHLEVLGTAAPFEAVTTSLVPKSGRPRRNTWDGGLGDRRPSGDAGRRPFDAASRRPSDAGTRPGDERPRRERRPVERTSEGTDRGPSEATDRGRSDARTRPGDERPRRDRPQSQGRPTERRPTERRPAERRPTERRPAERRPAERTSGEAAERDHPRSRPPGRARPPAGPDVGRAARPEPTAPRPRRLTPANTHRNAALEALPAEQRPIAEQLLQGGILAVRRALQDQNAKARDEGRPEIRTDALLALAEDLLPPLKAAEWRDRAEAAVANVEDVSLRDLRSVVAGTDAARDDESRLLAKTLREALQRREEAQRQTWLGDIAACLDEGRLVRALRASARPPDPRTRFPAELASRLSGAAGAALAPDVLPDRWLTVLEAVIESPVRRTVKPAGLPPDPSGALVAAARQASGRIPALAALLGIDMPPPPGPLRIPGRPSPAPERRRPPPSPTPPPPAAPTPPAAPSPMPAAPTPIPAAPTPPAPPSPMPAPGPDEGPDGGEAVRTYGDEVRTDGDTVSPAEA